MKVRERGSSSLAILALYSSKLTPFGSKDATRFLSRFSSRFAFAFSVSAASRAASTVVALCCASLNSALSFVILM